MAHVDPESTARAIVATLREAGHVAYFAGGCVRDRLLGVERAHDDYDVATSARPEEVQRLFPHTVAVGAQFGVILVIDGGVRVEVATFRADDAYVCCVSGEKAPGVGEGWLSYGSPGPAASAVLPAGWAIDPNNTGAPDDVWNQVIEDVDQVLWWYGDPTFFFIFEQWGVGLDNPRVTFASAPVAYCTAGTSASGCQALMSSSGVPSATAPSGFFLEATDVEGAKDGLFFFGTNGRQANPWGNGTSFQCVVPPVSRGGTLLGSGTNGACDGAFSQDLNARWTAKPAQNPGAGALVQAQLWYRDPLSTSNQSTSLSDALEFTVCPR